MQISPSKVRVEPEISWQLTNKPPPQDIKHIEQIRPSMEIFIAFVCIIMLKALSKIRPSDHQGKYTANNRDI